MTALNDGPRQQNFEEMSEDSTRKKASDLPSYSVPVGAAVTAMVRDGGMSAFHHAAVHCGCQSVF